MVGSGVKIQTVAFRALRERGDQITPMSASARLPRAASSD
jgi:hypothetical protein